jgi:hypothetical protein
MDIACFYRVKWIQVSDPRMLESADAEVMFENDKEGFWLTIIPTEQLASTLTPAQLTEHLPTKYNSFARIVLIGR